MATLRRNVHWASNAVIAGGIVVALVWWMSLGSSAAIRRGDRWEWIFAGGAVSVLRADQGEKLATNAAAKNTWYAPRWDGRPRMRCVYQREAGKGTYVQVPGWAVAVLLIGAGLAVSYRTREPGWFLGALRRAKNFRTSSRWGLAALGLGVALFVAGSTKTSRGVLLGDRLVITWDPGAVGVSHLQGGGDTTFRSWVEENADVFGPFFVAHTSPAPRYWPYYHEFGWGQTACSVPFWMGGAAAMIVGPVMCWRGRFRIGECGRCRYDLSGLPAGSACPECGNRGAVRGV